MAYIYLKLFHIIAVIIFLGNIFTGLFWMHVAVKSKDLKIISHTVKSVIKSDRLFTMPGVILLTTFGIIAAIKSHIPFLSTGWILWSIILFSISGIVFGAKVAPLQKKIMHLTVNQNSTRDFDWNNFNKVYLAWEIWGFIALITPFAALVLMILKIPQ
jgi:uncharacterized membrane protein